MDAITATAVPASAAPAAVRGPQVAWALLVVLIVLLQFGPFIGLVGFRLSGNLAFAFIGALRDCAVALLLGLAAMAALTGRAALPGLRCLGWTLAMVGATVAMAVAADADLLIVALNLRRLVLAPLLFAAVLLLPWTAQQVDRLFAWIVGSSVVVGLFGLLEWMLPPAFWTDLLDINTYTAANGFDRFGELAFESSGRFYSGDAFADTGLVVRRMVSTYLEPTTLAAAMAALLALALARRARGHSAGFLIALALVCGVATVSKGFVLFALLLLMWRVLGFPGPRHLLALCVLGSIGAWLSLRLHLDGPWIHIQGLGTALQHLAEGHWLGAGVGDAGNYTDSREVSVTGVEVGAESGLGNVIAQVGVVGVASIVWLAAIARDVLARAAARVDPGGPWIASWMLFWTLTYLYSASSLGVGGNAIGFVVLALYLHRASEP